MKHLMLSFTLFLAGCMTMGRPFPVYEVPNIILDQTTQKDLKNTFGEPYRTGIDDGDTTWTWVHYKLRLGGEQRTQDLYVRFNKNGTVKSYSFNSSLPEDRALMKRRTP